MPAIAWKGSPNFTPGRRGYRPGAIVIHIMDGSVADTDSWFATPKSQVSAHYGIGRDGTVRQYVAEGDTAWHAGRVKDPTWSRLKPGVNPNLYTIGIEHEGKPGVPWTTAMFDASARLVADVATRWAIPIDGQHVIGHCDIYASKQFCPGGGVDLREVIEAARDVLATVRPRHVVASGSVTTRMRLNVRKGAPSAIAPRVATLDSGTPFRFDGWTSSGQAVHGNAHWYRHGDDFIWAGGTDVPVPT